MLNRIILSDLVSFNQEMQGQFNISKSLNKWNYNELIPYYQKMSLSDYLEERFNSWGFNDVFWDLQAYNSFAESSEKYKKARSKWNAFVKNNLMFSDDFVKVGDNIEFEGICGTLINGTVTSFPKNFNGTFFIKTNDGLDRVVSVIGQNKMKINGEKRKLQFYIKRKRKIYGID